MPPVGNDRSTKPQVIAHRGASAYRPENTHAAFEFALELGADMLELDLHLTRDGVVVVAHDAELGRLGGRGRIGDATLDQIQGLDAGAGECVPTLEEVLDRYPARCELNLELKVGPVGPYPDLEKAALRAVQERGVLDRVLFSSFAPAVLETLRAASAAARLGVLVARRPRRGALERGLASAKRLNAEALHPAVALVQPDWIDEAHARGLALYPFTVDDRKEWSRLLAMGVDGIFTNTPDHLRFFIDSLFDQ